MSAKAKDVLLIATADWSQANNNDGNRYLKLEVTPFLRCIDSGAWHLEPEDRLGFQVQIINRIPDQLIISLEDLRPHRLSITFSPALRLESSDDCPRVTPFKKGVDRSLRRGLTGFRYIRNTHPGESPVPSALYDVYEKPKKQSGKPFRAKLKNIGGFDFTMGFAVDAMNGNGEVVERRRFRTDPEMNIGCSGTICDPPGWRPRSGGGRRYS